MTNARQLRHIQRVHDAIVADRKHFYMTTFMDTTLNYDDTGAEFTSCNTVGCLAGWSQRLVDGERRWLARFSWRRTRRSRRGYVSIDMGNVYEDAQRRMGLSDRQAEFLFYDTTDYRYFSGSRPEGMAKRWSDNPETRAIQKLRYMLNGGDLDALYDRWYS